MFRDKVRIRFRKVGDLRLVSHHDLMRCFERMLRRAGLPFRSSEGFNPRPRLVFALSLPLGVAGLDEVADLELGAPVPADEVRRRLADQAPPGLEVLGVEAVGPKARAHVCGATYRVALDTNRVAEVSHRAAALLAAAECWLERSRPEPRRLDVRPYLRAFRFPPGALEFDLRVTPNGTARPDEVLALLGLADLVEAGAVIARSRLELEEDNSSSELSQEPRPAARGTPGRGDDQAEGTP